MHKLMVLVLFILSFNAVFPRLLHAETSVANFIQFQPGARLAGLSGSFASITGDPWNVFNATAGTVLIKGLQAAISHTAYIDDITYEAVSASFPVKKSTFKAPVLSTGILYKHYTLPLTDESGELTGVQISPSDFCAIAGVAFNLHRNISFGFNAKFLYTSIDETVAWAPALDVSLLFRVITEENPLNVLGIIQNLGKPFGYGAGKYYLPITGQLAGVYRLFNTAFQSIDLSIALKQTVFQSFQLVTGYEHTLGNMFVYRFGWRIINDDWGWLSLGAGFKLQHIQIDYSFQPLTKMGTIHQVSMEVRI